MKLKMGGLKVVLLLLGVFMCVIPFSYGLSESCMTVYDEGRAPAVLRSPECPDWVLSAEFHQNQKVNCQFSTTKGRRRYQEDHISCNLDMKIPLSSNLKTLCIIPFVTYKYHYKPPGLFVVNHY